MGQTLLHGLFPVVRAEVLRLLFTNPGQELYVRELARLSFLSLQRVQDELAKLEAAKLIVSRSNQYQRFYCANRHHPLFATLRKLVVDGAAHRKAAARPRGARRRTPLRRSGTSRVVRANTSAGADSCGCLDRLKRSGFFRPGRRRASVR